MENNERNNHDLQLKIDQYGDMLFEICFIRLQSIQDAEDAVQETFYQYWKRAEVFDGEEHEKAWLIKVAMNACRKVWRSAWHRHRSTDEQCDFVADLSEERCETVEDRLLRTEENRKLLGAVMKLPVKYREIIHLFYYEELSVKEISEITGRKTSTITSQLTRGRELLKKSLKEEYDFA